MKNKIKKFKPLSDRRTFIKSTGAATAGLLFTPSFSIAGSPVGAQETLALYGGPKAVTASHEDGTTWPRYGADEEKAVIEVLRDPSYKPNDVFDRYYNCSISR
jgi:hypothetical protein